MKTWLYALAVVLALPFLIVGYIVLERIRCGKRGIAK